MCDNWVQERIERRDSVRYRSGKKRPTVWMTSSREAQGRWISTLTFARCEEARCWRYDWPCGAFTGRGRARVGLASKLLSAPLTSSVLRVTSRKTLSLSLCFAPRVFRASLQSACSWDLPCGRRSVMRCLWAPMHEMADGRKILQLLWLSWGASVKWGINPCWCPLYSKILSLTRGQFGKGQQMSCAKQLDNRMWELYSEFNNSMQSYTVMHKIFDHCFCCIWAAGSP